MPTREEIIAAQRRRAKELKEKVYGRDYWENPAYQEKQMKRPLKRMETTAKFRSDMARLDETLKQSRDNMADSSENKKNSGNESSKDTSGKGGGAREFAKELGEEYLKEWAKGKAAGGGAPFGGSPEKSRWGFGRIFSIVLLLALLWSVAGTVYNAGAVPFESGFADKAFLPLKPVGESLGEFGSFAGRQWGRTGRILRGEETFSLEGDYEEPQKKFGLELDDIEIFGLTFGEQLSSVEPLGFKSGIIVNDLDESVENFPATVIATIGKDDSVRATPRTDFISEEGEVIIKNPYNPQVQGRKRIPLEFVFDKKEIEDNGLIKAAINTLPITLNLSYEAPDVETNLEVFAVTPELYQEYLATDRAFRELAADEPYKSYESEVLSRMRFRGDVEARMGFDVQPVAINSDKLLAIQFRNNNVNNKAEIKSFRIDLPVGLEFREPCQFLNEEGSQANLKEELFEGINAQINERGDSSVFRCKVHISDTILGGSKGDVISAPHGVIWGKLSYDYTISKRRDIVINDPDKARPKQLEEEPTAPLEE